MDRNLIYAGTSVVLAGLLGFSWGRGGNGLRADDSRPEPHEIAVVDIQRVLIQHKGLKAKNEELQQEGKRLQEELKALHDVGQQIKQEFDAAKKGSAEQKRLEGEFQKKGQEFAKKQQEAQAYTIETNFSNLLVAYQQVNEEVTRIAEARGFKIVINFSAEPVTADQKDPQKRQLIFNRQVLYQNGLDITDEVIGAFN